jgi:hypothetical protein
MIRIPDFARIDLARVRRLISEAGHPAASAGATGLPPSAYRSRTLGDFEPVVLLQAVVATYVACVVGVAFFLGLGALTLPGLFFALLVLLYAFLPGILTLTALYLWLRQKAAGWFRGCGCVVGGAVGGFMWGAFFLLGIMRSEYFPLKGVAPFLLYYPCRARRRWRLDLLVVHQRPYGTSR